METPPKTTRCTACSAEFTDEEVHSSCSCPSCGSEGIPCAISDDVTVKINWHELRILGIWADNYAQRHLELKDRKVLGNILRRLQEQYPDKTPLTIFGEVKRLRETGLEVKMRDVQGNEVHPDKRGKA